MVGQHGPESTLPPFRISPKSVFLAFLVVLSIFFATHLIKFPGSVAYLMEITEGQKTFDLQGSFSNTETYDRLEAFGSFGRHTYIRTMLTVDLIFPISMFIFLILLAKYTSQQLRMKPLLAKSLRSFSIAYLALDFLENVSIFILLINFPNRLEFLGSYIGYITLGKRISMMGALFLPAGLFSFRKISVLIKKASFSTT